jgi:hypothetical protein
MGWRLRPACSLVLRYIFMSHGKTKRHLAYERSQHHITGLRVAQMLFLVSTASLDYVYGSDFDFPPICYVLAFGVILGLDLPTLYKVIKSFKK